MFIVHLEDDGPLREILAVALKAVEPDCELYQFAQSDEAVAFSAQHQQDVDLFVIDIRVPGSMDGLGVARKIREMNCSGTIVLTSAYRVPDKEVINQLNCEWFPKPWHILETTSRLLDLARQKRLARAEKKLSESLRPAAAQSTPKPPITPPKPVTPPPSSTPAPETPKPVTPPPSPTPAPETPKPATPAPETSQTPPVEPDKPS